MGWELIFAMAVAAAIQRGYDRSKRRSQAAWEQARSRARHRAQQRERDAERRRQAARDWFDRKRADNAHPVAWGHKLGWALAAVGGAAVAGVAGAREGAAVGAREGAHVGRRAAREGWGHLSAWREYKRQREAAEAQADRAGSNPKQAGASADGTNPDPPPVWVPCRQCGAAITEARAEAADGLCPACLDPQPAQPARDPADEDGEIQDAVVVEDLPACSRCGRSIEDQLYLTSDGQPLCADCRDPQHSDPAAVDPAVDSTEMVDDNHADETDETDDAERAAQAHPCSVCERTSADGPVYPDCQSGSNATEITEEERSMSTGATELSQGALTSGHEGGELGIEDTRTIYTQISTTASTTIGELIDRLVTSLGHFGGSQADISDAQTVAEAAEALSTAASTARANHDARNQMTEQAAVEETEAVRNTDYHRLGK